MFFGELPLIRAMLPDLAEGTIVSINRLGQMVVILAIIQITYKSQLGIWIRSQFAWLIDLVSNLHHKAAAVSNFLERCLVEGESVICGLFSLLIIYLVVFVSEDGPLYYLAYPLLHLWKAFLVWASVKLSISSVVFSLLAFIGLCFWAVISFICIYGLFLGLMTKAIVQAANYLVEHCSLVFYRVFLAFQTLAGGIILVFTTGPFK